MSQMLKKLSVVSLSILLLTGCGNNSTSGSNVATADATAAAADYSNYKIAMVTDTIGTDQFILQAWNELQNLSKQYGFQVTSVECSDVAAWTEKSRTVCDSGYNLLIGVGWEAAAPFSELADEYMDVQFAVIDTVAENQRIKSINFNTVEGSYVLGVMAATAFPNDKLFGYIGNYEQQSNYEYQYGYRSGVNSVLPDADLMVSYSNTYSDTSAVYDLAVQQAAAGCTFIMGSVSNSANAGIYQYALERAKNGDTPIYTSGLSVDQTSSDNPYIIFGLTKNTSIPVDEIIKDYIDDGTVTGGKETLSVKENAFCVVGVSFDSNYRNTDVVTDAVIAAGKQAAQDIADGKVVLEVPTMGEAKK